MVADRIGCREARRFGYALDESLRRIFVEALSVKAHRDHGRGFDESGDAFVE